MRSRQDIEAENLAKPRQRRRPNGDTYIEPSIEQLHLEVLLDIRDLMQKQLHHLSKLVPQDQNDA